MWSMAPMAWHHCALLSQPKVSTSQRALQAQPSLANLLDWATTHKLRPWRCPGPSSGAFHQDTVPGGAQLCTCPLRLLALQLRRPQKEASAAVVAWSLGGEALQAFDPRVVSLGGWPPALGTGVPCSLAGPRWWCPTSPSFSRRGPRLPSSCFRYSSGRVPHPLPLSQPRKPVCHLRSQSPWARQPCHSGPWASCTGLWSRRGASTELPVPLPPCPTGVLCGALVPG